MGWCFRFHNGVECGGSHCRDLGYRDHYHCHDCNFKVTTSPSQTARTVSEVSDGTDMTVSIIKGCPPQPCISKSDKNGYLVCVYVCVCVCACVSLCGIFVSALVENFFQ